ncbi:MAG: hypothetical protein ABIZ34_07740, partial [Candidatus Limnocylindrales bacterium]
MTTFDRLEPRFAELMDELAPAAVPDYLVDMLERSANVRQKATWSSVLHWVPAGVAPGRGRPGPRAQERLALLGIAAVVSVLIGTIAFLSTGRPTVSDPAVGASVAPSPDASPASSPSQSPRNVIEGTFTL